MKVLLVGAGGHAKAIVEAVRAMGWSVAAYVDPRPAAWLDAPRYAADGDVTDRELSAVIGVGGIDPAGLARRTELLRAWIDRGFAAPAIVHPRAHVSPSARAFDGAIVMAGAVVQPGATLGAGTIVNTGAVIEHDSVIGAGAHVAPGAVVLADCEIGAETMIGSNAVVLRGARIPPRSLLRAAQLHFSP